MGLWQRFKMLFQAKASHALDRAENPAETLDYSYQRQLEMLQKVKRGLAVQLDDALLERLGLVL